MRIWIDGYEANAPQRLGSSQVAYQLIKNLENIDKDNDYTILLPDSPNVDLPKERTGWRYKILKPKRLWTRIALPLALYSAKHRPDIFFSPTHYVPRFCPSKVKRVVTIFDLSFLHFPDMFTKKDLWQLKNWTKFSVGSADHIVTISQFSKKDIMSQYGVKSEKITVAYPGIDGEQFKVQSAKLKVKETYIIYIGTVQPRKNLQRLIEAFARVVKDKKELKLLIAGKTSGEGKQGWMYKEILDEPKELGIEDSVKFLGYVSEEEKQRLLQGALAFVAPSLWEGFGIPVVEAMVQGTPVIVSNVSSLPEVAGKAGLLVDPYSVDQIEQAIRVLVADKKLRDKYSKAGIEQAKKFTQEKMAKTVLKVFEGIKRVDDLNS